MEFRNMPKDQTQSPNDIANNSIATRNGTAEGNCPDGVRANEPSIAPTAAPTKAAIARNTCQCFARSKTSEIVVIVSADPRQLFSAQHVYDPVAADAALQHDRAAGSLFHIAHANGSLRDLNLL